MTVTKQLMDLKHYFFITCPEAVTTCDKVQYQDAGVNEKLKLKFHLLFCKTCNKYHKDNLKLSRLLKKSALQTYTENEKKHYKIQISNYLSKHPTQDH